MNARAAYTRLGGARSFTMASSAIKQRATIPQFNRVAIRSYSSPRSAPRVTRFAPIALGLAGVATLPFFSKSLLCQGEEPTEVTVEAVSIEDAATAEPLVENPPVDMESQVRASSPDEGGNAPRSFFGKANEEPKVTIEIPAPAPPGSEPEKKDSPKGLLKVQELSFGTLMGLCAGYFAKKTGRLVAIVIGGLFVFLQILAYEGIVKVDWSKISNAYSNKLDVDGDGKVTGKDAKSWGQWFINLLTTNFQMKSSFAAGFYLGLRVG